MGVRHFAHKRRVSEVMHTAQIDAARDGRPSAHAELRMSVVLDFLLAERACSHHWRLGGRVLSVPVKDQPV